MEEKIEGYIQCKVNPTHYYDDNLSECPYCADDEQDIDYDDDKTISGNAEDIGFDDDATEKEGQKKKRKKEDKNEEREEVVEDATFVHRKKEGQNKSGPNTKRIVGWLISYDYDPNGMDYKLYEGKNKFGSSPRLTNSIPGDKEISSFHFTIVFRGGKFKLKDEESTNGILLNGDPIDLIDNVVELKDMGVIKVGIGTTLYFRSAIMKNTDKEV